MSDTLNFEDLTPIQIPVKYQGNTYLLCEANGEAGTRYRNAVFSALRATDGGETYGLKGFASVQPLLVHLCLYEAEVVPGTSPEEYRLCRDENKNPIRVSQDIVEAFPNRMLVQLFERAKEISELGELGDSLDELKKRRAKIDEKIVRLQREEQSAKNE